MYSVDWASQSSPETANKQGPLVVKTRRRDHFFGGNSYGRLARDRRFLGSDSGDIRVAYLKGPGTIGLTLRALRHRIVRELTVLQIRLRPGSIPCTAGNMGI